MTRLQKIIAGLLILTGLSAQVEMPAAFSLKSTAVFVDSTADGLYSNIISDIRLQNDTLLWLGTGVGLSRLHLDSLTMKTYYSSDELFSGTGSVFLPPGGVAALAVDADRIAVAMAGSEDGVSTGKGIVVADSSRSDWLYFEQPVDDTSAWEQTWFGSKSFNALPISVPQQNVTYDAGIAGDYLWIASWAGGIRRYSFSNETWERVPLPLDDEPELVTCIDSLYDDDDVLKDFSLNPRDPYSGGTMNPDPYAYGNHNHKGFAVLAYGDTVWVGTANGINRGIVDPAGCIDWDHYYYPQDGLSGNWVVGLARQIRNGREIIWAVTLTADNNEQRGLSYTMDDGLTWHSTLIGERGYNVAAFDSLIFAATERGLWRSNDGENWALYQPAKQSIPVTGSQVYLTDEVTSNEVYSVTYDLLRNDLWIGTADGLAGTSDLNGLNWQIFRTEFSGDYAYPNPFITSSEGDEYVRFKIDVKSSFVVTMDIFNFAMQRVYTEEYDRRNADMGTYKWDGRDSNGRFVANGTYFIRMNYDNADHWLKLIVVK